MKLALVVFSAFITTATASAQSELTDAVKKVHQWRAHLTPEQAAKYDLKAIDLELTYPGMLGRLSELPPPGPVEKEGWRLTSSGKPVGAEHVADLLHRDREADEYEHRIGPTTLIVGLVMIATGGVAAATAGVLGATEAVDDDDAAVPIAAAGAIGAGVGLLTAGIGWALHAGSDREIPLTFGAEVARDYNTAVAASILGRAPDAPAEPAQATQPAPAQEPEQTQQQTPVAHPAPIAASKPLSLFARVSAQSPEPAPNAKPTVAKPTIAAQPAAPALAREPTFENSFELETSNPTSPRENLVLSAYGPGKGNGALALGLSMFLIVPCPEIRYVRAFSDRFAIDLSSSTFAILNTARASGRFTLAGDPKFSLAARGGANLFHHNAGVAFGPSGGLFASAGSERFQFTIGADGGLLSGSDTLPFVDPHVGAEVAISDQLNFIVQAQWAFLLASREIGHWPRLAFGLAF